MEACFLTSRSISSSTELVPFIKARIFSCPKRTSGHFPTRKVGSLITITCCHSDSWKPIEEDDDDDHLFQPKNSTIDTDWRTFRARLLAGEHAAATAAAVDPSLWANPDLPVDYPTTPIAIGHKWAHKIHEPEKGCLLIATEKLDGVHIFERTVILLLSVGPTGPIGIILNRPSLMSIKETKSTVLDVAGTFSDKRLFFGGPLEEGLFLVSPRDDGGEAGEVEKSGVFREVMKGVYYGTRESVGLAAEMVKRKMVGRSEFRFFDGYCGWDKEQLRDEIFGGYWTLAACSKSVIGLGGNGGGGGCGGVNSRGLWDEVLGLIGPQTGSFI